MAHPAYRELSTTIALVYTPNIVCTLPMMWFGMFYIKIVRTMIRAELLCKPIMK